LSRPPIDAQLKIQLDQLSSKLLKLHKALLEFQKIRYERYTGQTLNPYEALGAALNDPGFAWLKPISQMIVEIDLASTPPKIITSDTPVFHPDKIKKFWSDPPQDFHDQLIAAIQENPDISFLFSEVRVSASRL
jgi:hypothetical protein